MEIHGLTTLKCALPQIRTINIVTINGIVMKVKANSFFPWKMVVSDDVVAYMCCVDTSGTVTTNAKNSVEISKNEYDRLVEKFKVYHENNTCMIEGFVDYSEVQENAKKLHEQMAAVDHPVAVGQQHEARGITPCPELKGAVSTESAIDQEEGDK